MEVARIAGAGRRGKEEYCVVMLPEAGSKARACCVGPVGSETAARMIMVSAVAFGFDGGLRDVLEVKESAARRCSWKALVKGRSAQRETA